MNNRLKRIALETEPIFAKYSEADLITMTFKNEFDRVVKGQIPEMFRSRDGNLQVTVPEAAVQFLKHHWQSNYDKVWRLLERDPDAYFIWHERFLDAVSDFYPNLRMACLKISNCKYIQHERLRA